VQFDEPMTRLDPVARSDRPAGDEPEERQPGPSGRAPAAGRAGIGPAQVALLIVFAGSLWIAASPVNDIDTYWHVAVGRDILARHTLDGLGRQWLDPGARGWSTSQWLSEVLMYGAVDRFGWLALPMLRVLAAAGLYGVLWLTLVRRRQPIAAFVVVFGLVIGLQGLLQDRPATVSLLFVAALAPACERLWAVGRRQPPLLVAAGCLVWAQLHGLWVLAPAAFALVALGGVLDRRARSEQVRGALICLAASLTGIVNPRGPVSFLLPLRFRDAAVGVIGEWAPTSFTISLSIAWGILIAFLILAWARTPAAISWTELVWMLAWTVFGLGAVRNVGPALLMTAPVVLRALERLAGNRLDRMTRSHGPREARVLGATAAVVVLGGLVLPAAALSHVDPLRRTPALAIARRLAAEPGVLRVWDAYNASGSLVAFGGGRDGHLRLVVDGRSDLWGGDYISEVGAVANLGSGWESRLRDFAPDAVVVTSGSPIVDILELERHWHAAQYDGDYVLLVPPGSRMH